MPARLLLVGLALTLALLAAPAFLVDAGDATVGRAAACRGLGGAPAVPGPKDTVLCTGVRAGLGDPSGYEDPIEGEDEEPPGCLASLACRLLPARSAPVARSRAAAISPLSVTLSGPPRGPPARA